MSILRRISCVEPSWLRAFHSPSPSALMPVLSTARQLLLAATRGDQEVLRTCSTAIWQAYVQRSLTTAKGAEVWHRPIQPDELQQALHKTCGLSQRQSEQHFQSETGLDRSITEILLPTTLAARWWYPNHLRIKQIDSEPRRFKLSLYDDQIVVLYLVGINCL